VQRDRARDRTREEELDARLTADPVFGLAQTVLLAKLMLTVLVLDPRSFDTFTLPKSIAAHTTSLVLAALLAWLFARHGRSLLRWSPTHLGAGALLLAFALATPFAVDPNVALFGTFKRYLGLTQMLDNVLLYFTVGILFGDLRSLKLLVGVTLGTAVPVLGYALIQRLGLDPLQFKNAPTTVPITTIGNPDIAGAYVAILGITALALVLLLWSRLRPLALVACAGIGVAAVGVLLTTSVRGGAFGIAFGWLGVLLLAVRLPGAARSRTLAVLALGAALTTGIVLSPIWPRLQLDALRQDAAVQVRIEIWAAAERAIAERPLLGAGPDNFAAIYPSHRSERSAFVTLGETQTSTHDLWLYVATSSGLLGFAVLLLFVALLIERALRMARRGEPGALALIPLLAYLGQSLVGVNELAVDWMFWSSAGVIGAAGALPLRSRSRGPQRIRGSRAVGALAVLGAVVVGAAAGAPRLVAGEAMQGSEGYAAANRASEAIPYGQQAVEADPRRAEYWASYGAALSRGSQPAPAAAALTVAVERQEWQPTFWKDLAITWGKGGNGVAAFAAADRATRADPFDSEARDLLASVAYDRGDFGRAAVEGERALALGRREASTYFTVISAYIQLKELGRAEALSREATTRYDTARLRLQLAAILADEGKTTEATASLDMLLREDPTNRDALLLRQALTGK